MIDIFEVETSKFVFESLNLRLHFILIKNILPSTQERRDQLRYQILQSKYFPHYVLDISEEKLSTCVSLFGRSAWDGKSSIPAAIFYFRLCI